MLVKSGHFKVQLWEYFHSAFSTDFKSGQKIVFGWDKNSCFYLSFIWQIFAQLGCAVALLFEVRQ